MNLTVGILVQPLRFPLSNYGQRFTLKLTLYRPRRTALRAVFGEDFLLTQRQSIKVAIRLVRSMVNGVIPFAMKRVLFQVHSADFLLTARGGESEDTQGSRRP